MPVIPSKTWNLETGGSGIQGHPQLHSKLEASLGYMRFSFVSHPQQGVKDKYALFFSILAL